MIANTTYESLSDGFLILTYSSANSTSNFGPYVYYGDSKASVNDRHFYFYDARTHVLPIPKSTFFYFTQGTGRLTGRYRIAP